jgi:hypothetical protein
MATRSRLTTSIPFWVLFVGSLALTAFGAWMVFSRITAFEDSVRTGATDQSQQLEISLSTYTVGPLATVGGIILGAGIIGLLLTLAVGVLATLLPRPAVEVIEAIDWSSDDETALEADERPASVIVDEPVTEATTESAGEPAAAAPISEDPDVETSSDAPAPPQR